MITRRALLQSALFLPAVPILLSQVSSAQENGGQNAPWIEEIAHQLQREFGLPAVWLAVNVDGAVEAAAVGVRKIGSPTAATLDDRLTVASVSKPMVGLWIATLVDAGKINYNTRTLEVLPELEAECLLEHRDISLAQLLTHTAGLARDARNALAKDIELGQYPAQRVRQARDLLSQPTPPGSKGRMLYSNNGLTLAATMAERVVGEPYEVAASRFFRERLGLKSWGVSPMNLPDDLSQPWPHSMKGDVAIAQSPQSLAPHFVRPSGNAHCTISDLVRFGLLATGATPVPDLLSSPAWTTILSPFPNSETTLASFNFDPKQGVFSHGGIFSTTRTHLAVVPEWKIAGALHLNAGSASARARGEDLLWDAIRKRRAQENPPRGCRMTLTDVSTVDATWKNVVVPTPADEKVRIRVRFRIESQGQTGDLQTLVKLGDVERRDDRYQGLKAGNHTLHFTFETPKTGTTPIVVTLDALGTADNIAPQTARVESVLTLR